MEMNKAPLNKAHQMERRAEILNRQKKYDAAMDCHKEAVVQFAKCLATGTNKIINESIKLQKEWNERQVRLLELKKTHAEKEKKKLSEISLSKTSQKELENLETKIFRAMETHDSLIYYLSNRGSINEHKPSNSMIEEEKDMPPVLGNKHPKDESTVIEELKVLSGELRESVQGLLIQLDDRNKEIEMLKAYIKQLELEKTSKDEATGNTLKIGDSSGGTSPYVFSPLTELSPDIQELAELPSLPTLDLEPMPEFDIPELKQFTLPEVGKLFRRD